jgi:hypothetical protein
VSLFAFEWVPLLFAVFVMVIVWVVILVWAFWDRLRPDLHGREAEARRSPPAHTVARTGGAILAAAGGALNGGSGMNVGRMCSDVAESLWRVHHERDDAPHLIWPAKRGDDARISEQESKILITQWLENAGEYYSVETPTREMYRQSGNADMSARIDVTVYGSRHRGERVVNIELKAGTASIEAFRKDFEKLLREGIPGVWFHTLANASEATWAALEAKMVTALDRVLEHAETATNPVHFAFCVLETPALVQFDIDFAGDWRDVLGDRLRAATGAPVRPQWTATARRQMTPSRQATRSYNGATRKALVYIPTLEPSTFVHLSARGESYALRKYGGEQVVRWVDPECKTLSQLLARHPIVIEVDVRAERKPLDSECEYWAQRIGGLNRQNGIG